MDKAIVTTPEQQFFISGTYKPGKLSLNLSMQHIHNLYSQISPTIAKNSYTLFNTRIAWIINKYVDVFVKGENLLNKKYYVNYGYPMPGFIAFGGFNLHLN